MFVDVCFPTELDKQASVSKEFFSLNQQQLSDFFFQDRNHFMKRGLIVFFWILNFHWWMKNLLNYHWWMKNLKKQRSQQPAPSLLMRVGVFSGLRPRCYWIIHQKLLPFWSVISQIKVIKLSAVLIHRAGHIEEASAHHRRAILVSSELRTIQKTSVKF